MKSLKNLIITYEGHAFENIILSTPTKKNKSLGIFSVIREFKNGIFYNIDKSYKPNLVLPQEK